MKFLWHNFLTQQIDEHFYSDVTHLCEVYPFGDLYCNCILVNNNQLYITAEALSGAYKSFKCPETLIVDRMELLKLWNDTDKNLFFASFQINNSQILSFLISEYDECRFFLDSTDSSKTVSFVKSKTPLHLSQTTDNWVLAGWDGTRTTKLQSISLGDDSTLASLEATLISVGEPWTVFQTYQILDRMQWTFYLDVSNVGFYSWDFEATKSLLENSETAFTVEPSSSNLQSFLQGAFVGHDWVVFANNSTVITRSGTTYRMLHVPTAFKTGNAGSQVVFSSHKYNIFKELVVQLEGNQDLFQWSIGKILLEKHGLFSSETNLSGLTSVVTEQTNPWLKPLKYTNEVIMDSVVYDRFNDESDLI